MEQIKHLHRAEFDSVMKCGKDLILFLYKKNDPASTLGLNTMNEVASLIGKNFEMYLIDIEDEPGIADAFSIEKIPEYISMKNCKIYKRNTDLLEASQVLLLLK